MMVVVTSYAAKNVDFLVTDDGRRYVVCCKVDFFRPEIL